MRWLTALLLLLLALPACSPMPGKVDPRPGTDSAPTETFEEEFSRPHKAQIAYTAQSDDSWTGWNKFWFAAAVGGQLADIVSTDRGLDRGCKEVNPLFGSDPSTGTIVAAKLGVLALAYATTEYWVPVESRQSSRNWVYGALGLTGFAAGAWNSAQDCR